MSGFRYWRLYITRTRATSSDSIKAGIRRSYIHMLDVDGVNAATGGVPFRSTGSDAAESFDDSVSTGWASGFEAALPQWIGYDFGSPVLLTQVIVYSGNLTAQHRRQYPQDMVIQGSNDLTDWIDCGEFIDIAEAVPGESRTFDVELPQSPDVTFSGSLFDIAQAVGDRHVGTVYSIGQTIGLSRSGALLSIEQAIDLRLSGSGPILTIQQQTQSQGTGSLLTIGQRVRVPFVPSVPEPEYEFEVIVGNQVIDHKYLVGQIVVTREESSAALAEINLQPPKGSQGVENYMGRNVIINVTTTATGSTARLFTGRVDIPEIDLIGQRIKLRCSDVRSERNNGLSRAFVTGIGVHDPIVFGSPVEQNREIEDRLQTVTAALDYDAAGNVTYTQWQPKATPDKVLTNADVYLRQPTVELMPRGRAVNVFKADFQYRYARQNQRRTTRFWRHPISFGVCEWLRVGAPPLVPMDSLKGSLGESNFVRQALPRQGEYRCTINGEPRVFNFQITNCVGVASEYERDESGEIVKDAEGNSKISVQSVCIDDTERYAATASGTTTERWEQTITENSSLQISAPASVNYYGAIEYSRTYATEDERKRSDTTAKVLRLIRDMARSKILGSHRGSYVTFQDKFRPDIDLRHTIEVDTRKIKAKGKCYRVRHVYDCTDRWADTEIQVVLSRSVAQVSEVWGTPSAAQVPASIELTANQTIPYVRGRLEITDAAIPSETRQSAEYTSPLQAYQINVPNDYLEVIFDD